MTKPVISSGPRRTFRSVFGARLTSSVPVMPNTPLVFELSSSGLAIFFETFKCGIFKNCTGLIPKYYDSLRKKEEKNIYTIRDVLKLEFFKDCNQKNINVIL